MFFDALLKLVIGWAAICASAAIIYVVIVLYVIMAALTSDWLESVGVHPYLRCPLSLAAPIFIPYVACSSGYAIGGKILTQLPW